MVGDSAGIDISLGLVVVYLAMDSQVTPPSPSHKESRDERGIRKLLADFCWRNGLHWRCQCRTVACEKDMRSKGD